MSKSRTIAFFIVLLELIGASNSGWGQTGTQQSPAAGSFPDAPIGNAVQALVHAINSEDEAAIGTFADQFLSAMPIGGDGRAWPREKYVQLLSRLRSQSGGLQPIRVRFDESHPSQLVAIFEAKRTEFWVGLEFEGESQNPGQLRRIEVHVLLPPPAPVTDQVAQDQLSSVLRTRIQDRVSQDRFSGVVLIARGDQLLLHEGFGMADRENGQPNTPDTLFRTASVGKMFTGVAIGQLVEKGLLKFDDLLSDVLPDYPNQEVARRVKVHHLLTHTSGLADPFFSPDRREGVSYETPRDNLNLIGHQPLKFEPGGQHEYSNGNYAVLAAIVERISGQNFTEYVRENIYRPAGMAVADPATQQNLIRANGYTHPPESDPLALEPPRSTSRPKESRSSVLAGFGGVEIGAEDLFRFFRALRTHRLLGPEMTSMIVSGKVSVGNGAPLSYAYGFYDHQIGERHVVGHSGGGGNMGYGAHAEIVWENEYTLIVLGNRDLEYVRPLTLDLLMILARQP